MEGLGERILGKGRFLVSLLRKIAERRGITLYKLAEDVDIPRPSIYYYDKNPGRIPLEKADEIRAMAGLTWDEFGALAAPQLAKTKRKTARGLTKK